MAILEILRMGDPRLQRVARPVETFDTAPLHALVTDLWDTMAAANGAGLAAPQVGVDLRVVAFGCEHNPRYPDARPVPRTVLINPRLEPLSDELEAGWEGCLSIPGMRGLVLRYMRLRYTGFDPWGQPIRREVDDFHARVAQHECDHLDGILYPQRITDLRYFGFNEELIAAGLLAPLESPQSEPARASE